MNKNVIKLNMAGCVNYNGINCRLRTAFENDKGEQIYFEFGCGHQYDNKQKNIIKHFLHIDHLFRLDIEQDMKRSNSPTLREFEKTINAQRLEYTEQTIKDIIKLLGIKDLEKVIYTEYEEYTPHGKGYNEKVICNA